MSLRCSVRHVYARLLSGEFDLGALAELALAAATVLAVLAQEHPVLVQGCLSRRAGHSPVSGAVLRGCWTLLEAVRPGGRGWQRVAQSELLLCLGAQGLSAPALPRPAPPCRCTACPRRCAGPTCRFRGRWTTCAASRTSC